MHHAPSFFTYLKQRLFLCWIPVLLYFCGCSSHTAVHDSLVAIQIQDRNGVTETISTPERLATYQNIDFLAEQPYKKVLRVYRADGKNRSTITAYHPNGTVAQYLEAQEMRANGYYREWFPNGQMKIEAVVIGGTADITPGAQKNWLFDGVASVWDDDGHLVARIPYDKGVLHGKKLLFYPSGKVKKETSFVKDLQEGESITFYPTGQVRVKKNYRNGQKHGHSEGFFENGALAWKEEFTDGLLLNGLYYNSYGDQISEVYNGRGMQVVYQEDFIFFYEMRQGIPEGIVKKFTTRNELVSSYALRAGRKQGEEIEYYLPHETQEQERKPKLSVHWDQDSIHGIVKTWHPNGQLQSQCEYCHNKKLGPSCAWYSDGSLMFVEEYEEDRLIKGAYYKKNQKDPSSTIVNGNGIASLYDADGTFLKKVTYAKGKPIPND